jgi:hypothetical protein
VLGSTGEPGSSAAWSLQEAQHDSAVVQSAQIAELMKAARDAWTFAEPEHVVRVALGGKERMIVMELDERDRLLTLDPMLRSLCSSTRGRTGACVVR